MTPTEILRREHDLILRVIERAETELIRADAGEPLDLEAVDRMLDFFRGFADRCHHAKEERLLFVRLQERGVPAQGGPVGVMLHEHDLGRAFLRAVADSLPAARSGNEHALDAIREALAGYATLLRAHIGKENNILFPMADRLFTAEDQAEVGAGFDQVEEEEMGAGVHEKYHTLAHELIES